MVKGRTNDRARAGIARQKYEEENPAWQSNSKVGSRRRILNNKASYTWKYKNTTGGLSRADLRPEIVKGYRGPFNRATNGPNPENPSLNAPNVTKKRIKSITASNGALQRNEWVIFVKTAQQAWFAKFKLRKAYPAIVADPVAQMMYHASTQENINAEIKSTPVQPKLYPFFRWTAIESLAKNEKINLNWATVYNRHEYDGQPDVVVWNPFDIINGRKQNIYEEAENEANRFYSQNKINIPDVDFNRTLKNISYDNKIWDHDEQILNRIIENENAKRRKEKDDELNLAEIDDIREEYMKNLPKERKKRKRENERADTNIIPANTSTAVLLGEPLPQLLQVMEDLTDADINAIGTGELSRAHTNNVRFLLNPKRYWPNNIFAGKIQNRNNVYYYLQDLYRLYPTGQNKNIWLNNFIIDAYCIAYYCNNYVTSSIGFLTPFTFELLYNKTQAKKTSSRQKRDEEIDKRVLMGAIQKGFIVIPNMGNNHWITIHFTFVDEEFGEKSIVTTVYDSFQNIERQQQYIDDTVQKFAKICEWFSDGSIATYKFPYRAGHNIKNVKPWKKQSDGSSCGIYAIRFFELLLNNDSVSYENVGLKTKKEIWEARADMANFLITNSKYAPVDIDDNDEVVEIVATNVAPATGGVANLPKVIKEEKIKKGQIKVKNESKVTVNKRKQAIETNSLRTHRGKRKIDVDDEEEELPPEPKRKSTRKK